MTDPKNSEAQNEELGLEQLEDAAGGVIHPSYMTDPTKIVDPIQKQRSRDVDRCNITLPSPSCGVRCRTRLIPDIPTLTSEWLKGCPQTTAEAAPSQNSP